MNHCMPWDRCGSGDRLLHGMQNSTRRQNASRRQAGEQESPATAAAGIRRQSLVDASSLQELRLKVRSTQQLHTVTDHSCC